MSERVVELKQRGWTETSRRDAWWLQPLLTFLGLAAFLAYANVRVFEGAHYHFDGNGADYLTPFYSPLIFDSPGHTSGHAWLAERPAWIPSFISAAALILIFPAGFRFTCYYYRGAYYKAFWADPPNCAVGEPRKGYLGENSLPLILQNIHRYFLYFAIIFLFILSYDAWKAMWFKTADGVEFGLGLGTLILIINPIMLTGYTLGCHSLRHLIGGGRDVLSDRPMQKKCYDCVSGLNKRHMLWAWMSLFWVAFTDVYVRMCAVGTWTDWRLF